MATASSSSTNRASTTANKRGRIGKEEISSFISGLEKYDFTSSDPSTINNSFKIAINNSLAVLEHSNSPMTSEARAYIQQTLKEMSSVYSTQRKEAVAHLGFSTPTNHNSSVRIERSPAFRTPSAPAMFNQDISALLSNHTRQIKSEINQLGDRLEKRLKSVKSSPPSSSASFATIVKQMPATTFVPTVRASQGHLEMPKRAEVTATRQGHVLIVKSTASPPVAPLTLKHMVQQSGVFASTGCVAMGVFVLTSGVKLLLEDQRSVAKVAEEINKSEDMKATKIGKRKPQLELKYIDNSVQQSDLITKYLLPQNQCLSGHKETDMKLLYTRKIRSVPGKPECYNAIIETNQQVYRKIVASNCKLAVNLQRVAAEPHLPFKQCLRCCKFGHTAKYCSAEKPICALCAGEHQMRECPHATSRSVASSAARSTSASTSATSEHHKCINCMNVLAKQQAAQPSSSQPSSAINHHHAALSPNCPLVIKSKKLLNESVDW